MEKFFFFSNKGVELNGLNPEGIGFKAFNLMKIAQIGLPVPPGFVIGTKFCQSYFSNHKKLSSGFNDLVRDNIIKLQQMSGLAFGGVRNPLLVSVRSGAAVSMPGILDSILNIGICDKTVSGLLRMTGNPRFVWDSYRRLIETYASVVYDCSIAEFTSILHAHLKDDGAISPDELDVDTLKIVVNDYLKIFEEQTKGIPFPQQPDTQLQYAIEAVFRSWESPRSKEYRRINNIQGLAGTAVTVQTMVFGNMDQTSGSGVAFTRNPSTGENNLYAEFLFNSQGEDIVSGRRSPEGLERLEKLLPEAYKELHIAGKRLERHFKDMQDFEFTIQQGNLFILQSRNGKRTPWAALVIAIDMVNDSLIDTQTALRRLESYDLEKVERRIIVSSRSGAKYSKNIQTTKNVEVLANGVPASPGIAIGKIVLDSKKAKEIAMRGEPTILVRTEFSTDDISGLDVSEGVLTKVGGKTSHAALVSRQMNKVCIVGCQRLSIDMKNRKCTIGKEVLYEEDYISLDGNAGSIYQGKVEFQIEKPEQLLSEVKQWNQPQKKTL
jgi:pyruvate,orthophosphate dikinase